MNARAIDAVWLVLLTGTGFTWWLAETGHAGRAMVMLVLGIAFVKGTLVIREFMALRGVRWLWQAPVIGWLALVLAVILATYWQGA